MAAVMAAATEVAVAIDQTGTRSSFGLRAEPPAAVALTDAELSARGKELFRQVRAEEAANMSEDEKRRKREQAEERRETLADIAADGLDLAITVARSRSAGTSSGGHPLRSEVSTTPSGDGFGFLSGSLDPGFGLGDAVSGIAGAVGDACGTVGGAVGDVVGGVVSGIGDLLP
jgi:hypothetical protein